MKYLFYLSAVLLFGFISCKKEKPNDEMINDDPTTAVDTIGEGTFTGYQHSLAGDAILYTEVSGNKILRLEDFNMTAGPDVYVYLSTTSSFNAGAIQVAQLAVNTNYTNSNINFTVSSPSYTSSYKYVLVYCVQFSALFGYTELL